MWPIREFLCHFGGLLPLSTLIEVLVQYFAKRQHCSLDWSKFKEFADNTSIPAQMVRFIFYQI